MLYTHFIIYYERVIILFLRLAIKFLSNGPDILKNITSAATDRDIALACSVHLLDWEKFLLIEQLFLPCLDRVWQEESCVLSFLDSWEF